MPDPAASQTKPLAEEVEFALNPEPRCPVVVLADTSGSMQGEAIRALNEGLRELQQDLVKNSLAAKRVEIAVVAFDDQVEVRQDFVTANQFQPPVLDAGGVTNMGAAITKALDMVEARKDSYRKAGLNYYRPWIFLITDGAPTDSIDEAAKRVRESEAQKRVAFFAVGVEGADMAVLNRVTDPNRPPVKLQGLKFVELFVWLSKSIAAVGTSAPGQMVALPPATGWAQV
jgi:uncharacterized protein YegL